MHSTKLFVLLSICVLLITSMPGKASADEWNYVGKYAPILCFQPYTVDYMPTRFMSDPNSNPAGEDMRTYVMVIPYGGDYIFQYWFYYKRDVRWNDDVDGAIVSALNKGIEALNAYQGQINALPIINTELANRGVKKAFHNHDWELVEVVVPRLGERPRTVNFFAHGKALAIRYEDLQSDNSDGYHAFVSVVSDSHATYPLLPNWNPLSYWTENYKAIAEWVIAGCELGTNMILGSPDDLKLYTPVSFESRIVLFSDYVRNYDSDDFDDFPYQFPWEKEYSYQEP